MTDESRQPGSQLRPDRDQDQDRDRSDQKGDAAPEDRTDLRARTRHGLDDEEVHPHRRGDHADLDQEAHDDAEPDRIEAQLQDDGIDEGEGHDHHGDPVEEAAQDDRREGRSRP